METEKTDENHDEADELFGKITTATAGNSCAVVPTQSSALPGFEPIFPYEYDKSSSSSELCNLFTAPEALEDGKINSVEGNTLSSTLFDLNGHSQCHHEALTANIDQTTSWSPDEKYLPLAFQNMTFQDTVNGHLASPFFEHGQNSLNNPLSPAGNYSARLNQLSSGFEPMEMQTHLPRSMLNEAQCSNLIPEGCPSLRASCRPNMHSGILGHNDARLLNGNFHHPSGVLGDHNDPWQAFPAYSASLPVNHGMDTFFQPGVSLQGFEFPASPHLQEYYMASPYYSNLTHQSLNQYNILCSDMECERNYRNLSQYRCFDHLGNQCLHRHILNSSEPLLGGEVKPCLHMPSTQQVELVNPNCHWNGNMVRERNDQLEPSLLSNNLGSYHLNQSSSSSLSNNLHSYHLNQSSGQCENLLPQQGNKSFPSGFYCPGLNSYRNQAVGRFGKEIVPEKILTRSHGGNSLQNFESGSVVSNQLQDQANKTRRVSPKINARSSVFHCGGSVNLDVRRSQGSSFDNSDQKHNPKSHIKYDSLDNVMRKIHIFARDQNCCRFLQSIFDKGHREDFDKMFLAIDNHVTELATDPFGNYFMQKLIEVCTEEQLTYLIHKISHIGGELRQISFNQHGTRVVQKIIETMKAPVQYSMIVTALKPDIVSLMKNNNASHVAHRCLENLPHEYREFLFEAAVDNCIDLARDSHGCCLIQKYLCDLVGEPKFRLVCKLASEACDLSQNPYGNYVVQYIIDRDVPWATTKILDHLEGHYRSLSVQKFSSNVVEKCLKFAADGRRGTIIWELIKESHFIEILRDPYGNYVIQAALRECKGALRAALIEAIRPHEQALLNNRYGRKVLSSPCYDK